MNESHAETKPGTVEQVFRFLLVIFGAVAMVIAGLFIVGWVRTL